MILGILASSGVSWTPKNLTNLKAWYDASDTSTITVSGSSVTQWNDKSTNGYNLTQSTGTKQPQSGTTTLNSKNVIAFDGGDRLVASTAANWKFFHDGTKCLIGVIVKFSTSSDPQNLICALGTSAAFNTTLIGTSLSLEDRPAAGYNNGSRVGITRGVGGTAVVLNDNDGVLSPNSANLWTHLTDPSNGTAADRWSTFVGTGTAQKANTFTGTVSTSDPTYPLNVGWSGDEGYVGVSGYIAEIVIASGTDATESNRIKLRDYLKTKWAL